MSVGRAAIPAGLVALAALLGLGACRGTPAVAEKPVPDDATLAVIPATLSPASAREPVPVRRTGRRASVPPGVLARAAEARALERGPVCPPTPGAVPAGPAACAPEPLVRVEIEWDGAREP